MNKRIIHPNSSGGISVIIPSPNCDISIDDIAKKDTPAGVPYLIVDTEIIPSDREFRSAWEADFSNPDGYGIGADAWFAEQKTRSIT